MSSDTSFTEENGGGGGWTLLNQSLRDVDFLTEVNIGVDFVKEDKY